MVVDHTRPSAHCGETHADRARFAEYAGPGRYVASERQRRGKTLITED
jgi:hypothetical protein